MSRKSISQRIFIIFIFVAFTSVTVLAQTTAVTYQGRLTDAGMPPTASYDFQLTLFDAGGVIIAAPQQRLNVPVTNGVFNISFDFGAGAMVLTAVACP